MNCERPFIPGLQLSEFLYKEDVADPPLSSDAAARPARARPPPAAAPGALLEAGEVSAERIEVRAANPAGKGRHARGWVLRSRVFDVLRQPLGRVLGVCPDVGQVRAFVSTLAVEGVAVLAAVGGKDLLPVSDEGALRRALSALIAARRHQQAGEDRQSQDGWQAAQDCCFQTNGACTFQLFNPPWPIEQNHLRIFLLPCPDKDQATPGHANRVVSSRGPLN